jgi:hypothetical protein
MNIAPIFVRGKLGIFLLPTNNQGIEAAGKVINTIAPIANEAARLLSEKPLGGISNKIAGGFNTAQRIVQKGIKFLQNL